MILAVPGFPFFLPSFRCADSFHVDSALSNPGKDLMFWAFMETTCYKAGSSKLLWENAKLDLPSFF